MYLLISTIISPSFKDKYKFKIFLVKKKQKETLLKSCFLGDCLKKLVNCVFLLCPFEISAYLFKS